MVKIVTKIQMGAIKYLKMAAESANDPKNEICQVRIMGTTLAAFLKCHIVDVFHVPPLIKGEVGMSRLHG